MSNFWIAFVWGIGATAGGSIGMMTFVVMLFGWRWLVETKAVKRSIEVAELSLSALEKRNEISCEQIAILERLTSAVAARK